jgi:hypothetical protein
LDRHQLVDQGDALVGQAESMGLVTGRARMSVELRSAVA